MKYLLIPLIMLAFIGNVNAQFLGFEKRDFNNEKGKIKVFVNDSTELLVKPSQSSNFNGKYASYLGMVNKVSLMHNGYALLMLGDKHSRHRVIMFTRISKSKAMRFKGRWAFIEGTLQIYKNSPAFYNYKTDTSKISIAKIVYPGCNCQLGEPNPPIIIDSLDSKKENSRK